MFAALNTIKLIYINYDRFSPDALNRASAWEGGGVVLAHEIGHYFGLLHTFEAGCKSPDDAVTDTPPNLDPESGWQRSWLGELTDWCKRFRRGQNPDPKLLMKYKSCPNRGGGPDVVDNVFNMMSYLDDVCRMAWTENQVCMRGGRRFQCAALLRNDASQSRGKMHMLSAHQRSNTCCWLPTTTTVIIIIVIITETDRHTTHANTQRCCTCLPWPPLCPLPSPPRLQVARMQWGALTYRPKMMAKYAAKA